MPPQPRRFLFVIIACLLVAAYMAYPTIDKATAQAVQSWDIAKTMPWLSHLCELLDSFFTRNIWFAVIASLFVADQLWFKRRYDVGDRRLVWRIILALTIMSILTGALKVILGRSRPELFLGSQHIFGFHYFIMPSTYYYHSMPSGHCAGSTAFFLALYHFGFSYRFSCYLMPPLVAASRVLLNHHFVSDTLVGISVGIIAYLLADRLSWKLPYEKNPAR